MNTEVAVELLQRAKVCDKPKARLPVMEGQRGSCSEFFMCMHVWGHSCMCVVYLRMFTCVDIEKCTYVLVQVRVWPHVAFSIMLYINFWDKISHCTQNLLTVVGWPVNETQRPSCLHIPRTGITAYTWLLVWRSNSSLYTFMKTKNCYIPHETVSTTENNHDEWRIRA